MSAAHRSALRALADAYLLALTPGQINAYLLAVADLDADAVRAAVVDAIQSGGRFIPRPADLRRAVLAATGAGPPTPGEAWEEVVAEMRHVGSYGAPEFSHDLIARAVRQVGGWLHVCQSEMPGADRARFLDAYQRLLERHERETLTAPALGQLGAGTLRSLDPGGDDDPPSHARPPDAPEWN